MSNLTDSEFVGKIGLSQPDPLKQRDQVGIICGNCGNRVSGWVIAMYAPKLHVPGQQVYFVICPYCGQGTVIDSWRRQYPGVKIGDDVQGLPGVIKSLYEEVRACFSVGAFTAAELLCRKILMNVACDKGDKEGKEFVEYVDFLESLGYIGAPMKDWVDKIRKYPNLAAHKIASSPPERALDTFEFMAHLLITIYEMEYRKGLHDQKSGTTTGGGNP